MSVLERWSPQVGNHNRRMVILPRLQSRSSLDLILRRNQVDILRNLAHTPRKQVHILRNSPDLTHRRKRVAIRSSRRRIRVSHLLLQHRVDRAGCRSNYFLEAGSLASLLSIHITQNEEA